MNYLTLVLASAGFVVCLYLAGSWWLRSQDLGMITRSGERVWFWYPERTQILDLDLKTHLGTQRRYAGAIDVTILEHLVLCILIARHRGLDASLVRCLAIHDVHEAYVLDIPTGLKRLIPGYSRIEARWEARVHRHFGVIWPLCPSVKRLVKAVDLTALAVEMRVHQHPALAVILARDGALDPWEALLWFRIPRTREEQWNIILEAVGV